jgi:hypothetical protein
MKVEPAARRMSSTEADAGASLTCGRAGRASSRADRADETADVMLLGRGGTVPRTTS